MYFPKICRNELIPNNIIIMIFIHLLAFIGIYLTSKSNAKTNIFAFCLYILSGLGITAGVHRLWSHRAYRAHKYLQIFLCICNTIAFEESIYNWSRDHRLHHKFSDTEADPHNSKRYNYYIDKDIFVIKMIPKILIRFHLGSCKQSRFIY